MSSESANNSSGSLGRDNGYLLQNGEVLLGDKSGAIDASDDGRQLRLRGTDTVKLIGPWRAAFRVHHETAGLMDPGQSYVAAKSTPEPRYTDADVSTVAGQPPAERDQEADWSLPSRPTTVSAD